MKTPQRDYNGDHTRFMIEESRPVDWRVELFRASNAVDEGTNGIIRRLSYEPYTLAGSQMFGCTTVIVFSESGVWVGHFWESPNFRRSSWRDPRTFEDEKNFLRHVIQKMKYGDPPTNDIPGLQPYSFPGRVFAVSEKPKWAILTPRMFEPGTLRYDTEVQSIKDTLTSMMPTSEGKVVDYFVEDDDHVLETTSIGRWLFQYDPEEGYGHPKDPSGPLFQRAELRLWVEDRLQPIWDHYWPTKPRQLGPNSGTNHPRNLKRDDGACSPSAELPQASEKP